MVAITSTIISLMLAGSALAIPRNQCTGTVQCCRLAQSTQSTLVKDILGGLGIKAADLTGTVGIGCTAVPSTSTTCSATPLCCTGSTFNGAVNLGCTPVTL